MFELRDNTLIISADGQGFRWRHEQVEAEDTSPKKRHKFFRDLLPEDKSFKPKKED